MTDAPPQPHWRNVGTCGHLIAQCACDGVREEYLMHWACIPCQNGKAPETREETNAELHASPGFYARMVGWWRERRW